MRKELETNINSLELKIAKASKTVSKNLGDIFLIAVSKKKNIEHIRTAVLICSMFFFFDTAIKKMSPRFLDTVLLALAILSSRELIFVSNSFRIRFLVEDQNPCL